MGAARLWPDGSGFPEFLDELMRRALVPPDVGAGYKVTCLEVLPAVFGQDWRLVDVTSLDVDQALEEFQLRRGRRLPAAGLKRYRTRLTGAFELFREFVDRRGLSYHSDAAPSGDAGSIRDINQSGDPTPIGDGAPTNAPVPSNDLGTPAKRRSTTSVLPPKSRRQHRKAAHMPSQPKSPDRASGSRGS